MMFLNPNIRSINGIKSHKLLKGFFTYKLYDLYESFNRPHKLYDDIFWQLKQTFDWAKSFLTQPFLLDMSRSSPGEESRSLADKCQNCAKNGIILSRKYIGTVS